MDRLPGCKCDFCGVDTPVWAFPAEDFYHKSYVEAIRSSIAAYSRNEWAACDPCAKLIHEGVKRDDHTALAIRTLESPLVANTNSVKFFYSETLKAVIKFQDAFRRNRLQGPPVLIG